MPLLSFAGQTVNSRVYHRGDGLFYHVNRRRADRRFTYLRCIHYNSKTFKCPGNAKALLEGNRLYHLTGHSHEPNELYPEVLALKRDIFDRVKHGDQTAFHEIMQQEGQR